MTEEFATFLKSIDPSESQLYLQDGHVVAAYLRGDQLEAMVHILKGVPSSEDLITLLRSSCATREVNSAILLNHPWQLLSYLPQFLDSDFKYYNQAGIIKGDTSPFTVLYNEHNIYIDAGTTIEDFVVIDARKGPVYIESGVTIQAHTRLEGPLFIGKGSTIFGGRISRSSIGPECKICGEVSSSIFHGHANKAHDGYIGDSFIGEWVNLGAFTSTSNLKSTYSDVAVVVNNRKVDTARLFLGSIIGDFVKTGIHTSFNAGTTVHFGSTLFDAGFHDKEISPFTWGSAGQYEKADFDKFLQTTAIIFGRRNTALTDVQKALYMTLFHQYS